MASFFECSFCPIFSFQLHSLFPLGIQVSYKMYLQISLRGWENISKLRLTYSNAIPISNVLLSLLSIHWNWFFILMSKVDLTFCLNFHDSFVLIMLCIHLYIHLGSIIMFIQSTFIYWFLWYGKYSINQEN